MGLFTTIAGAILGGIGKSMSNKTQAKNDLESTKAAGHEDRKTAAFQDDREYFRRQQERTEKRRSLDSSYNQFSTVREFAPNYKPGTGLDAMGNKPMPEK